MHVTKGSLNRVISRDSYWTPIRLKSSTNKETLLVVCASHEYLGTLLKTNDLNAKVMGTWVDSVVKEWESKGDSIFKQTIHLDVKAVTEDGYKNGLSFLKQEVVPNF